MIATVLPPSAPLTGDLEPPSSKNFTTRYVLAACLAEGRSVVHRPAVQDDAVALVRCARDMGAEVTALDARGRPVDYTVENASQVDRLEIHGFGNHPRLLRADRPLNPGNAGAVFRMLLAVSALLPEVRWETDHADSLGKRPHGDLLEALRQLGVEVRAEGADGRLPIELRGGRDRIRDHVDRVRREQGLASDEPFPLTVSGEISSQYTSALLFLAPLLGFPIRLSVTGRLKSLPLIETTRRVLSAAGIEVESSNERDMHLVRSGQHYKARRWETNGDWPGAAAILAAAAVVPRSRIRIARLYDDEQGERECVPFFERMGCRITREENPGAGELLCLESPERLRAAAVNGDLCTDAVLAMEAAAACAEGTSRFVQIRNLQFKECDRVREPLEELRKVYATSPEPVPPGGERGRALPPLYYEPEDDPDTIHITGRPEGFRGGTLVDGRGDHRVIMMLSIVALRCEKGLRIAGAEHASKSFPGWFDTLRRMGVTVE